MSERITPTHAILTGITGRCTPPPNGDRNGFGDYHALADFYAPSIVTLGLAMRAETTKAEIIADLPDDFPALPDTSAMTGAEFVAWAREFCTSTPTVILKHREVPRG